jgi:hypothetical protein
MDLWNVKGDYFCDISYLPLAGYVASGRLDAFGKHKHHKIQEYYRHFLIQFSLAPNREIDPDRLNCLIAGPLFLIFPDELLLAWSPP